MRKSPPEPEPEPDPDPVSAAAAAHVSLDDGFQDVVVFHSLRSVRLRHPTAEEKRVKLKDDAVH